MNQVPPPRLSPEPPRIGENEPITGSHEAVATTGYVRRKQGELEAEIKQAQRSTEHRAVVLFVLGALAMLGTGFLSVRAIAQDAGRAEVVVVAEKQRLTAEALAAHIKDAAERDARVERKLERQDEKQDLILDALRVPLWKRPDPEPKDGGR